jgi:hypothetical protein
VSRFVIAVLFLFAICRLNAQDSVLLKQNDSKTKVVWTDAALKIDNDSIENLYFLPQFKTKYQSEAFVYEVKSQPKNNWNRFKEWLSEMFSRLFSFDDQQASMAVVELVLKILAIALILFVIYLIVKSIMNKEGQWIFGKKSDRSVIRYDEIEKNLHLVDFEKLIKDSIKLDEKRLTIRYYYLWLLKKMSEKQVIEWDIEKTNSDYLYEIKNEKLKEQFGYVSYLYNYIWYGEFDIDAATFEKATATFQKTIQSI